MLPDAADDADRPLDFSMIFDFSDAAAAAMMPMPAADARLMRVFFARKMAQYMLKRCCYAQNDPLLHHCLREAQRSAAALRGARKMTRRSVMRCHAMLI